MPDRHVSWFFGVDGGHSIVWSVRRNASDGFFYAECDIKAVRKITDTLVGTYHYPLPARIDCAEVVEDRSKNLIIVGGPAYNSLSEEILCSLQESMKHKCELRRLRRQSGEARAAYCWIATDTNEEYWSTYDATWRSNMTTSQLRDWALIASYPNPNNPACRAVFLAGLHAAGTLGAAMLLCQPGFIQEHEELLGGTWAELLIEVPYHIGANSKAVIDMPKTTVHTKLYG